MKITFSREKKLLKNDKYSMSMTTMIKDGIDDEDNNEKVGDNSDEDDNAEDDYEENVNAEEEYEKNEYRYA